MLNINHLNITSDLLNLKGGSSPTALNNRFCVHFWRMVGAQEGLKPKKALEGAFTVDGTGEMSNFLSDLQSLYAVLVNKN
ncbi:MAG: hypothetical protein Q8M83_06520 [bacterium]|nr:hypothetical protein [bacterium]